MEIADKIDALPTLPGVYLMKGGGGGVIYIGKARNLRSRVRSYFRKTGDTRYAARYLATKVRDIDYIVTANEKEALILEDTLLKKHKPRYNIRLKDDKTYVSIKLTVNEEFPRILVTRRVRDDGARYFGPYASARMVRDTVKFIRKIFPLCVCTPHEFRNRTRPCLDYQLGICAAPAVGLISAKDYRELVDGAILFLEGRNRELLKSLKTKMQGAAKKEDFEEAAVLRDRVNAIEATLEEQRVVTRLGTDEDVFGLARSDDTIAVVVLFVRDGRLVGSRSFFFVDTLLPGEEVLGSFLRQFYAGGKYVPREVLTSLKVEDSSVIGEWLTEKRAKKCVVRHPARGPKARLTAMAEANAEEALRKKASEALNSVSLELQKRLRLKAAPHTIEAFDISNIGRDHAVGAMVTFVGGEPDKNRYRRYRIRHTVGPNDYAMMYEVLSRRYASVKGEDDTSMLPLPELILIDGGKGQLAIAEKVKKELGLKGVALAALAKDKGSGAKAKGPGERVFLPGVKDPVVLREGSRADLLLRRIRDEVHRFAITYHRKLRGREIKSVVEDVPGIGKKKKQLLFERFKDLEGLRKASIEEITALPGFTAEVASELKRRLGK